MRGNKLCRLLTVCCVNWRLEWKTLRWHPWLPSKHQPIKGPTQGRIDVSTTELVTREVRYSYRRTRYGHGGKKKMEPTRELSNLKYRDGIQMSGQVWPVWCNRCYETMGERRDKNIKTGFFSCFSLLLAWKSFKNFHRMKRQRENFTCHLPVF